MPLRKNVLLMSSILCKVGFIPSISTFDGAFPGGFFLQALPGLRRARFPLFSSRILWYNDEKNKEGIL